MALSLNGSTGISGINGSAGTPALQGGDADTGIFFGTDTASIATAGANRLHVTSTGLIGVGTSSPAGGFHVDAASGVDGPVFDSGGTANTNHALLVRDSSNNQLLRVNNNGDIGIGVSNPQSKLDVRGGISVSTASNVDTVIQRNFAPTGSYSFILSGGAGLTSEAYPITAPTDASAGPVIKLIGGNPVSDLFGGGIQYHANGNLSPTVTGPGNAHVFYTRAGVDTYSERFRIRHDGGVTFNGDTATANALDDYEEGTFTPDLGYSSSSSLPSVNYSRKNGSYVKIGRTVWFALDMASSINWPAIPTINSALSILGLPFVCQQITPAIIGGQFQIIMFVPRHWTTSWPTSQSPSSDAPLWSLGSNASYLNNQVNRNGTSDYNYTVEDWRNAGGNSNRTFEVQLCGVYTTTQ